MADEAIMTNNCPFTLFPRELWDIILEKLEDSHDILQITQIYPELKELSLGKEFSWLIGDIMPFILPKFLNFQHDIKSCRLVSKRWRNAIEATYETHPDRLPYNSPKLGKITEHHFSYHPLPKFEINIQRFIETCMGDEYEHCDDNHNPFPGRFLKIQIGQHQISEAGNPSNHQILLMLEKFGHNVFHIRFVPLSQGGWDVSTKFVENYINNVMEYLVYLPNLRSLFFEGFISFTWNEIQDTSRVSIDSILPIPILAHLEMLDLSSNLCEISKDIFHHIFTGLVKGGKIRMIGMHYQHWDTRYKDMFPNLTELRVNAGKEGDEEDLASILQELRAPCLRKLTFDIDTAKIDILAKILAPYQIETLELCGDLQNEFFGYDVIDLSIKHLRIMAFRYTDPLFLKLFPRLENLSIKYNDADFDGWEAEFRDEENVIAIRLLNFLMVFKPNLSQRDLVWESLPPKLEMITTYRNPTCSYLRESPDKVYWAFNSNPYTNVSH